MPGTENIEELERRRDTLIGELAAVGDFRPGSLAETRRRCDKPTCHRARPGDPAHPGWALMRRVGGKTVTRGVPRAALEQTRVQVAEHKRFRDLTRCLVEASESPVPGAAEGRSGRGAERAKRGLRSSLTPAFAADIAAEIDALADAGAADGIDFEALETAIRRLNAFQDDGGCRNSLPRGDGRRRRQAPPRAWLGRTTSSPRQARANTRRAEGQRGWGIPMRLQLQESADRIPFRQGWLTHVISDTHPAARHLRRPLSLYYPQMRNPIFKLRDFGLDFLSQSL